MKVKETKIYYTILEYEWKPKAVIVALRSAHFWVLAIFDWCLVIDKLILFFYYFVHDEMSLLSARGNETFKYFIPTCGNRTHKRRAYVTNIEYDYRIFLFEPIDQNTMFQLYTWHNSNYDPTSIVSDIDTIAWYNNAHSLSQNTWSIKISFSNRIRSSWD